MKNHTTGLGFDSTVGLGVPEELMLRGRIEDSIGSVHVDS